MDINIVVLSGKLAADPELQHQFDGQAIHRWWRALVTVRRPNLDGVDVLGVIVTDSDRESWEAIAGAKRDDRIWVTGSLQRKFPTTPGRPTRYQVVASHIEVSERKEAADG